MLEYTSSQYPPDLLAEGIDVSIYLSQQLPDSGLVAIKLGQMFSVLCAAPAYLARHGRPDHPRELATHNCLGLTNPSLSAQWELHCGDQYFSLMPSGSLAGNVPEVLLNSTIRGLGISLLPVYSVVDDLREGRLVHVLPAWHSSEIGIFALLPSRRFVDAKARAWIDLLKQALPAAVENDTAFFTQSRTPRR
jgi:DNA-binding transcriptional LysR family regulator